MRIPEVAANRLKDPTVKWEDKAHIVMAHNDWPQRVTMEDLINHVRRWVDTPERAKDRFEKLVKRLIRDGYLRETGLMEKPKNPNFERGLVKVFHWQGRKT